MKFLRNSRTNWKYILIIVILALFVVAGFFTYRWWQVKGELARQIEENENLTRQMDELQKEIEELKAVGKEAIDETADWKTYKSEYYQFEIKYPSEWKVEYGLHEWWDEDILHGGPGQVGFLKKEFSSNVVFSIGVDMWHDRPSIRPCEFRGEKIIVEGVGVYPNISTFASASMEELKKLSEEEICEKFTLNKHNVFLDMCFYDNLNYLGNSCPWCPESSLCPEWKKEGYVGDYYQFSLFCEGERWKGGEGANKCDQLFNQIISTFKFIK